MSMVPGVFSPFFRSGVAGFGRQPADVEQRTVVVRRIEAGEELLRRRGTFAGRDQQIAERKRITPRADRRFPGRDPVDRERLHPRRKFRTPRGDGDPDRIGGEQQQRFAGRGKTGDPGGEIPDSEEAPPPTLNRSILISIREKTIFPLNNTTIPAVIAARQVRSMIFAFSRVVHCPVKVIKVERPANGFNRTAILKLSDRN